MFVNPSVALYIMTCQDVFSCPHCHPDISLFTTDLQPKGRRFDSWAGRNFLSGTVSDGQSSPASGSEKSR